MTNDLCSDQETLLIPCEGSPCFLRKINVTEECEKAVIVKVGFNLFREGYFGPGDIDLQIFLAERHGKVKNLLYGHSSLKEFAFGDVINWVRECAWGYGVCIP